MRRAIIKSAGVQADALSKEAPVDLWRSQAMAAMTEKAWLAQVREVALLCNWTTYHTHDSRRSEPGYPDLLLLRPPRAIVAELKTQRGKATAAQLRWLELFRACGLEAYLWRPMDMQRVAEILGPRGISKESSNQFRQEHGGANGQVS